VKKYRTVHPVNGWPRRLVRDIAAGMVALKLATAKPRFRIHGPKMSVPPRGIPTASIEAMRYFATNYDIVADYALSASGPKIHIGMRPRSCRFCGRHEGQVSFKKVAHAVSEAIGNKVLLSLEECDECNSAAAECETDFAAFTLAERTMGQVRGKSGVPSVKSNDRLSRIDMGSDGFEIGQVQGGQELFKFDEMLPGATAAVPLPGFRPQGVYKAMAKMALSVIPRSELDPFADVLKWISNRGMLKDIGYAAASWHTFTSGPHPYPFPLIRVLRRKHDGLRVPYAIVVIGFGNVTLQAVLPAPSKDSLFSEDLLVPPPHPTPHVGRPWPYSFETTERINLNWPEKVRGKIREVRMNATLVQPLNQHRSCGATQSRRAPAAKK
jgi:hypothetical protein